MTIIDLHSHYTMHLGLPSVPADDPVQKATLTALFDLANEIDNYEAINRPRVTPAHLHDGGPTGFGSVLYDPEDEFLREQRPHPGAFDHILQQIVDVEKDAAANNIAVVKTRQQLADCLAQNRQFMFHCVEGGHGLGGDPANVAVLAEKGIAYFILTHLRYMGLATCADGLPCKTDFWNKIFDSAEDPEVGITHLGFQVLDALFATNIVFCLNHLSDMAQDDLFRYYKEHGLNKPIIASHNAVRTIANYQMNLRDEAIDFIGKTGGTVGVVAAEFWLKNDADSGLSGVDIYCRAIDYLRNRIGDDCVSIGTDLDGFVKPINECRNYSKMQSFAEQLAARYPADFVDKLLWKNAKRILDTALG